MPQPRQDPRNPAPGDPFDVDRIGAGLAFAASVPELAERLSRRGGERAPSVVVQAPPGTGKTTLVPPVVANASRGKIIVTQPRRVAARAAARRLAQLTGTRLGELVGFAVKGERRSGPRTQVEFVTPGLLLRRLLADPGLDGVGAVVLDEVHERSLDTDLLLALLADIRALREDLTLVAMSATLDAPAIARVLGGGPDGAVPDDVPTPIVEAASVAYPLAIRWAPSAAPRLDARGVTPAFLDHVARTAVNALDDAVDREPSTDGLVFLPGVREVERVAGAASALAAGRFEVLRLHGSLTSQEQDRVLSGRPTPDGKPRLIVSTALAESSLTVPGVRLVVDAGLSREPRRDASRGMSGLVTVSASRASSEQRAGRAARLGPGTVVRCFDERTFAAAPAHVTPEILTADLTDAALTLAAWGAPDGEGLAWLNPPPPAALDAARRTLSELGAVDPQGRITPAGKRLAGVPLEPRWARALLDGAARLGAPRAAEAVAVATAGLRADGADLTRLARTAAREASVRREAQRLNRLAHEASSAAPLEADGATPEAVVAALAWPGRVARNVRGRTYLLAQGTRAALPEGSSLAGQEWLAIADVARAEGRAADGTGAVIRLAAPLTEASARELAAPLLSEAYEAELTGRRVVVRRTTRLGAIEIASTPTTPRGAEARQAAAQAVGDALAREGIGVVGLSDAARTLRNRLAFLRRELGEPWPDVTDEALSRQAPEWLAPELDALAGGASLDSVDLLEPLRRLLPWPEAARLDELAPERLRVPSGNTAAVRYPEPGDNGPAVIAVKLQEMFGQQSTPRLAGGRAPVLMHLLSPAGRPLAITEDLASFWAGPYAQVRAEMRGRYPKHPWPEDPLAHEPTARTTARFRAERS